MPNFNLSLEDLAAAKGLFDFAPQGPMPAGAPPPQGLPPPGTQAPGTAGGPAYAAPPGIPMGALAQSDYRGILQGVLQPTAEDQRSARTTGLLQAALGVLAHSYTRPGQGWAGVAEGLSQGLSGYGQALDQSRKRGLENLKLGEYVSGLQQQQALRAALASGDQDKVRQILTLIAPKEAATQMLKPQSLEERLAAAMNDPSSPFYQGARRKYLGIKPDEELAQENQQAAAQSDITAQRERANMLLRENLERGRPTKETWTTSTFQDESGNPVQVSNLGNTRALPGVSQQAKPVPFQVEKRLVDQGQIADTTQRLATTFQPEYGGHTFLGDWSNYVGRLKGDTTGQVQWWADYQNHTNSVRNKLFGSALTPTEQAEWTKANVDPRMDSGEIQKNLDRRQRLEEIALDRMMKGGAAAGYKKAEIEALSGRSIGQAARPGATGSWDGDQSKWHGVAPSGTKYRILP